MAISDGWQTNKEFTIKQSALLIVGCDPQDYDDVETNDVKDRPRDYEAFKQALSKDVLTGKLRTAVAVRKAERYFQLTSQLMDEDEVSKLIPKEIDLNKTAILHSSLRYWLAEHGIKPKFFFPIDVTKPDYSNPNNEFYCNRLFAAVSAWEAVIKDKSLYQHTTPKQALIKWLQDNADKFGLVKPNGELKGHTIMQLASIANWKPNGGASETPTKK